MIWTTVHGCKSVAFVDYNAANANTITLRIERNGGDRIEVTLFDLPTQVTDVILNSGLAEIKAPTRTRSVAEPASGEGVNP